MKTIRPVKRPAQQGFSLVELMIALVLGLVVTLAATQMFTVSQRTLQLQQAMAAIQEEGQLTLRFLVNDIRQAGFYEDGIAGEVGVVLTGNGASSNGASGANDQLTIAYHGQQDCTGNDVPDLTPVPADTSKTAARVVNRYWVDGGTLKCTGNSGSAASPNTVSLLDNVQSFQVLYGIRASELGTPRVERYVTANDVGSNQVIAIKVGFLLRNDTANLAKGAEQSIVVLDEAATIAEEDSAAMHRLFYRTVALRNFNWEL